MQSRTLDEQYLIVGLNPGTGRTFAGKISNWNALGTLAIATFSALPEAFVIF